MTALLTIGLLLAAYSRCNPAETHASRVAPLREDATREAALALGAGLQRPRGRSALDGGLAHSRAALRVVDDATALLETGMRSRPEWHAYLDCLARPRSRGVTACRREIGDAVFAGWHLLQLEARQDTVGMGRLVAELGADAAYDLVATTCVTDSDPLRRIAGLIVLERTPHLAPRELPPGAYQGLVARSDPEAQLLLARHEGVAITHPGVAAQIADLVEAEAAGGRPSRVSRFAIAALGHPSTSSDLERASAGVLAQADADWSDAYVVGASIARCGSPCDALPVLLAERGVRTAIVDAVREAAVANDERGAGRPTAPQRR